MERLMKLQMIMPSAKKTNGTMGNNHYGGFAAMIIEIASKARDKGEAEMGFIATKELT